MSRIFWESNLFVYLFEDYGGFSEAVVALRCAMLERRDQLLTSTLTLAEIVVKPIERGDVEAARKYEEAVTRTASLLPFDLRAARIYAQLRTSRTLGPPDAIQPACAAAAEAYASYRMYNRMYNRLELSGQTAIVARSSAV